MGEHLAAVFLGLGYLIVFGSVIAFTSYTWLLQRVPPALVATHTYANPVVAVILGWFLAHEHLTLRVVLASVAILGAIVLIRRGEGGRRSNSRRLMRAMRRFRYRGNACRSGSAFGWV